MIGVNDRLLSTKDAAAYLGVSIKTIQAWRHRGEGPPFYRLNGPRGAVRYSLAELRAFANSDRIAPNGAH